MRQVAGYGDSSLSKVPLPQKVGSECLLHPSRALLLVLRAHQAVNVGARFRCTRDSDEPAGKSRPISSQLPNEPVTKPLPVRLHQPRRRMGEMDRQYERASTGDFAEEALA